MLSADLRAVNALMDMRLEEVRQQAKNHRLRQVPGPAKQGWLNERRCWLLCQMGQLLTSIGHRLEQLGLAGSIPVES